jgi:tetratricopeptide (TPR) repeat protein
MINGNNDKAYRAIKKEYDIAYLDMATNMTTMTIALQYVNRPEDIEAIYNEISMSDMILENCSRCGFRYYLKGLADVELGKYSEVINLLLPITNIIEANYLKRPLISAYIKSQDYATFDKYIKDLELTTSQDDLAQLLLFSGKQMLIVNQKDKANFCFDKVITLKNELTNKAIVANAYFLKEDYVNAQKSFKELYNAHLDNIDYLVHLSISNFEIGNFTEGKKLILSLDKLRTNYQFGEVDYAWAKYYKSIGNKDNSLESLLKSVSQGYNFTPTTVQNDPYFKAYKDTPQFEKIMKYWNRTL